MKDVAAAIGNFSQDDISKFEQNGTFNIIVNGQSVLLEPEDVEILSEDIPGWQVANEGRLTVALDTKIDEKFEQVCEIAELLKKEVGSIFKESINESDNIQNNFSFKKDIHRNNQKISSTKKKSPLRTS